MQNVVEKKLACPISDCLKIGSDLFMKNKIVLGSDLFMKKEIVQIQKLTLLYIN